MLRFLFGNSDFISHLIDHCYSRSITSLLILLLNIRKTLRLFSLGETLDQEFDSLITTKRQEFLSKIAVKCIDSCDDPEQLEAHLNCQMILVDAMENFDAIQNGRGVINWVLFESNPMVLQRVVELLMDNSKQNYGLIPELLNHICGTVKKVHSSVDGRPC